MRLQPLLAVFTADRAVQALQRWVIDTRAQLLSDPGRAKAWARAVTDGLGGITLEAGHNVSRVEVFSTHCRLYFAQPLGADAYVAAGSMVRTTTADAWLSMRSSSTKNYVDVMIYDGAGAVDPQANAERFVVTVFA